MNVQETYGSVFAGSSATLLARLSWADGQVVAPADVAGIRYRVTQLAPCDPAGEMIVPGHDDEPLGVAATLSSALQVGAPWTIDAIGFNFRHEVDVSENAAFPVQGRSYQVRYEVEPHTGQTLVFRFHIKAI